MRALDVKGTMYWPWDSIWMIWQRGRYRTQLDVSMLLKV